MADPFLVSTVLKVLAVLLAVTLAAEAVVPLSLGCSLDTTEQTIRCRSNNLDYIVKSMYILVPEKRSLNGSEENRTTSVAEPREVDIFYCEVPELPNIFGRFNSSLEVARVARSNVQLVMINAFEGLESKLRVLDLSGNKLRTVPLAVQNLTRLEVLNLIDNKIQVIAEGPTFGNTKHLRELHLGFNNLGYIDASKLQLYPSSPKNNNRKNSQHTPIGLAVFNLGNITNSLEILSLRGNGMHNYPEQLLTEFPRLKSLDLSFNSLIEVPEDAFRTMPELQLVNLDSNFIRTIKFSSLPETLKLFTMKNNPMRCDCDVKWILDWIFTNTSLTVLLPKCNAPFHLREISFLRLTSEKLCNQSHINRQTVYVTDRDLSYFPQGVFQSFRILDVKGEFKSIFVSWKVDPQFYLSQREWLIIYRDFGDSIYRFNRTLYGSKSYIENQTDWTSAERIFSDSIRNLTAGHYFQICMAVVENNINYVHLNHCRVAQTEKEVLPQYAMVDPNLAQVTTTTAAPDPDYLIESNFSQIKADAKAITVYWSVTVRSRQSRAFYKDVKKGNASVDFQQESPLVLNTLTAIYNELKWKIEYRKFATEEMTSVTIMKNNYIVTGPNTHQYTIANLRQGTGYSVCFETVDDLSAKGRPLLEPGEKGESGVPRFVALDANAPVCQEVETLAEEHFPSTEVAIASTISAAVTAVLLGACICLLPRVFKKRPKAEEDPENASQNTVHTDTALEEDEDDEDLDSDEEPKSNGGPKWKNSHPRIQSIFPTEDYRNGVYSSSFRNFNGIPPYPGSQRNGTYPKSILKKSPSAPVLSEAMRHNPILKRPSSVTDDQSKSAGTSDELPLTDALDLPIRARNTEAVAVEMTKLFTTATGSDSDSDAEKAASS